MAAIHYLTHIECEAGAVALLPGVLAELGMHRPLLVTDAGIVQAGILARVVALLPSPDNASVFTATPPNPTEEAVEAATAQYLAQGSRSTVRHARW